MNTLLTYNFNSLKMHINSLKTLYHFIEIGSIGKSILGRNIPYIKIGRGSKEVLYCGSFHANEWITTPILMKFVTDYCYAYKNNLTIWGNSAMQIFNTSTLYIVPMVNPDGVDLVTGFINSNSPAYHFAKNIANEFPSIPFPSGWKANIRGVDLNLQFPAGWEKAREIKYSQGFTRSCSS